MDPRVDAALPKRPQLVGADLERSKTFRKGGSAGGR